MLVQNCSSVGQPVIDSAAVVVIVFLIYFAGSKQVRIADSGFSF